MLMSSKTGKFRSWRAFVEELVTIVIGVLIALGCGQLVQAVHWREASLRAEETLNVEVRRDITAATAIVARSDCVRGRLEQLRDRLVRSSEVWRGDAMDSSVKLINAARGEHFPARRMPRVIESDFNTWSRDSWDSARTSNTLDHLPKRELMTYENIYGIKSWLSEWESELRKSSDDLAPLAFDQSLNSEQKSSYLSALARYDTAYSYEVAFATVLTHVAESLKLGPNAIDLKQVIADSRQRLGSCVHMTSG